MRKLRKQAKELLQAAQKVYNYRRDVILEAHLAELEKAVQEVESMFNEPTTEPALFEASMKRLDALLRKVGGMIYPKTFWSDNLEVLLVAVILVIGVRTFFLQPFIIPTNSMYPTYNGMTYRVYADDEASPGSAEKLFNKLRLGASYKSLYARNDGTLLLPVSGYDPKGNIVFQRKRVKGRKWLIIPAQLDEYVFYIGETTHILHVPAEFNLSKLLRETFVDKDVKLVRSNMGRSGLLLDTGHYVKRDEPILRFNVNLGDALFVERFSYHFRRPQVGDPFVFRSREVDEVRLGDKYFIKRIAGTGGDTLEIRDKTLLVDGKPRDEAEAFSRNASGEGDYTGYVNVGVLAAGRQLVVPENTFVSLGDNSSDSNDSRYWGFVPDKSVIGKAIFIYYPFTKRWGLAK